MKQDILNKAFMAILIVLNLGLLVFVFTRPKPDPNGPRPERRNRLPMPERIGRILNLSVEQKEAYKKMGREHYNKSSAIEQNKRALMQDYFSSLNRIENSQKSDSLMREILELEEMRLMNTYDHFQELAAICSEEQLENFDEVIKVLLGERGKRPPPPPGRRRDGGR